MENQTQTAWKNRLLFVSCIAIAALLLLLLNQKCSSESALASKSDLINALNDTLHHFKNKDGKEVARITALETDNANSLLEIKSKDATIIKLQEVVKEYKKELKKPGSSVTVFNTESNYAGKTKTDVGVFEQTGKDTIPKGLYIGLPYGYSNRDTTWLSFRFTIDRDSTGYSIKTKDSYSVVLGEESQGWFKRPIPFVDVINDNPHTATKKLRTWKVEALPPKKWHIGPGVFYGIGTNFKPQVFIGAGIMWTPINF